MSHREGEGKGSGPRLYRLGWGGGHWVDKEETLGRPGEGGGCPKISKTAKLPRGDILVKPVDGGQYKALKDMEVAGKQVREERTKRPTVLIYDVDRDLTSASLPRRIVDQNLELGLEK